MHLFIVIFHLAVSGLRDQCASFAFSSGKKNFGFVVIDVELI